MHGFNIFYQRLVSCTNHVGLSLKRVRELNFQFEHLSFKYTILISVWYIDIEHVNLFNIKFITMYYVLGGVAPQNHQHP